MAGRGIYAKHDVKPGDAKALSSAVAHAASRTADLVKVRDVQRQSSPMAHHHADVAAKMMPAQD